MEKTLLFALAAFSMGLLPPVSAQQFTADVMAEYSNQAKSGTNLHKIYYLVVFGRNGGKNDYGTTSGQVFLPMANEMECEAAGLKISGNQEIHGKIFEHLRYICVKGVI